MTGSEGGKFFYHERWGVEPNWQQEELQFSTGGGQPSFGGNEPGDASVSKSGSGEAARG